MLTAVDPAAEDSLMSRRPGNKERAPGYGLVRGPQLLIFIVEVFASIFSHNCTWANATLDAFRGILDFHQVFALFLDCVQSFGSKKSEDEDIWNGYRRSIIQTVVKAEKYVTYGKMEFQNVNTVSLN